MCAKGNKMENTAWKGKGVSGPCHSTTATERSPTDGARQQCVLTATVPWTSFCSLDMQQINYVGYYSISSF